MMLQLITDRNGRALANDVSEQFIHPRIRGTQDRQRMAIQARLGVANQKLIAAIGLMESTADEPRDVQQIAADVGSVTKTARAPVREIPACEPEPPLSGVAARPGAGIAAANHQAHSRRGGSLRVRVSLAFQPLLSRRLRSQAERRAVGGRWSVATGKSNR
jgi:hypothetical protein